jgi:hypothetical protein
VGTHVCVIAYLRKSPARTAYSVITRDAFSCELQLCVLIDSSGTLLEVPALEAALQKADHALVPLSGTRWKWKETDQWPPLTAVLQTPVFKLEQYEPLRARLRQPAPTQITNRLPDVARSSCVWYGTPSLCRNVWWSASNPTVTVGGEYVSIDVHSGATTAATTSPTAVSSSGATTPTVTSPRRQAASSTAKSGIINVLPMGIILVVVFHISTKRFFA